MFHDFKLIGTDAGLDFEIHLDPGKQLYCFFGANGVGKTNLLQNLGRTLFYTHSMFVLESSEVFQYGGSFNNRFIVEPLKERSLDLPTEIILDKTVIKDQIQSKWRFTSLDLVAMKQEAFDRFGANASRRMIDCPVVVIGTNSRGHATQVGQSELQFVGDVWAEFLGAFDRTWNAATGDQVPTQGVAAWIAARLLVNPAFVVGASNRLNEVVALCELLVELDPEFRAVVKRLRDGHVFPAIVFRDGKLWLGSTPIDKLATGYIAVIKIFQEIIASYGAWSGFLKNPPAIREMDGLVLIDEIEAHLHPRWQVGLVSLLKRAFPKTTFVVCTHSPLVVAQTSEGEAYELVRTQNSVTSRRLGSPRDWYLADVYANAFHVELPAPGESPADDEPPLADVLIDFSAKVKDFLAARSDEARAQALQLHERISARLPADDPRRTSLEALRRLCG